MNSLIPKIDIRPDHWEIVRDILHKHVPDYEVWAFGSRAKWTAKQYSDLDLAVITAKPLSLDVSASLSDDFSESDLPWKVDIVDWAATQDHFREIIKRDKVVVQKAKGLVMSSDWKTLTLNEIVDFGNGKARPKTEGNIPIYGGNGVLGYSGDSNYQDETIIIGRVGAYCGATYFENNPIWVSDNALSAKAKKGFIAKYAYYVLKSKNLNQYAQGSSHPLLTQGLLNKLEAYVTTNVEVQEKIVSIIGDIEDKIESNRQTNQTLEQIAQAIFKSWFVDFDPVKAKIETLAAGGSADDAELAAMSVISAKTVDELNSLKASNPEAFNKLAQTAALFPAAMQDSELGEIPEGWEIGTLDSHTSMIIDHRGKTPKKLGSDWVEEGYPAISAKNIKSKKIVRSDTIRFVDEVTYKKWMKEPLIKGDIIMTSEAPMGELYFYDGSQDFCLSQRLYGLRANSDVCSPEFLFNWLQTTGAKSEMEGRASGTTALGIKQAELRKVKILTPPRELLEKYSVVASNLVNMAAKNNAQNTILEDLRDTLLPKLLSGEIDLTSEVIA